MTENATPTESALRRLVNADAPAPADARDRVRARLAVAIPAMRRDPGDGGPGGAPGGGFGALHNGALAVAAFVLGGVAGAGLLASLARAPQTRVVYVDRPVPRAIVKVAAIAPPAPMPALPVEAQVEAPTIHHPAQTPAQTHASQLAAERTLLDQARAALVVNDPGRAIDVLARHEAHFPSPILGEERDAMEVEALVNAGRASEARAKADAFRAKSPQSLFLATVDSAIASIH